MQHIATAARRQLTFNWRRFLGLLLFVAGLTSGACGSGQERPVVVFGSPDSPRLQETVAGLTADLAPRRLKVVSVPEFGLEGDKVLKRLRSQHPALFIALGSPALLRVAPVVRVTPVVFTMVANPYAIGVADDPKHPDIHQKNLTGIASPPPVGPALELGARLLGPGPWGLLYDPGEGQAMEVAQLFTTLAPKYGLTTLTETSTAASGDRPALEKLLARGARVLYLPPTAAASRYAPLILSWGRQHRVKVVSSQPEVGHEGAILWVALDYQALGKETAALARRVLAGEKPENIAIVEKMPLRIAADEGLLRYWSGYPAPAK